MAQGLPCSKEKGNFSLSGFLLTNTGHEQSIKSMIGKSIDQPMTITVD